MSNQEYNVDYIKINKEGYDKIYESGWGNRYADSNLISMYYNNIRALLPVGRKWNCLDFGCSLGANTQFFHDIGFDMYGLDISQTAIDKCIEIHHFPPERFMAADILKERTQIKHLFPGVSFDLIIAANVLYYFTDSDIRRILCQFIEVMNEGAVLYANMHTKDSTFYNGKSRSEDGLYRLENSGSIDSMTCMNAVDGKDDMIKLFNSFQAESVLYSMIETKENFFTQDYHYVGRVDKV